MGKGARLRRSRRWDAELTTLGAHRVPGGWATDWQAFDDEPSDARPDHAAHAAGRPPAPAFDVMQAMGVRVPVESLEAFDTASPGLQSYMTERRAMYWRAVGPGFYVYGATGDSRGWVSLDYVQDSERGVLP